MCLVRFRACLLAKTVAKLACKSFGRFSLPYIFEPAERLWFDIPATRSVRIVRRLAGKQYTLHFSYPESEVGTDGRYLVADDKAMATRIAPVVIHSFDSTVIKHAVELLADEVKPGDGFSTIHDCLVVPSYVDVQSVWNESVRRTYKQFGAMYVALLEIFDATEPSNQHRKTIARAYRVWKEKVNDASFVDSLTIATAIEYE